MSLTKSDLNQIRGVVREEVESVVDERLETKLNEKLKPITKELRYIRKTVDIIVKDYDERDVRLDRRVTKIEQHLGLPIDS